MKKRKKSNMTRQKCASVCSNENGENAKKKKREGGIQSLRARKKERYMPNIRLTLEELFGKFNKVFVCGRGIQSVLGGTASLVVDANCR